MALQDLVEFAAKDMITAQEVADRLTRHLMAPKKLTLDVEDAADWERIWARLGIHKHPRLRVEDGRLIRRPDFA